LFSELSRRIIEKYNISSMILIVSVEWTAAKKIYMNNGFEEKYLIYGFFDDETNSNAIVMRKYLLYQKVFFCSIIQVLTETRIYINIVQFTS